MANQNPKIVDEIENINLKTPPSQTNLTCSHKVIPSRLSPDCGGDGVAGGAHRRCPNRGMLVCFLFFCVVYFLRPYMHVWCSHNAFSDFFCTALFYGGSQRASQVLFIISNHVCMAWCWHNESPDIYFAPKAMYCCKAPLLYPPRLIFYSTVEYIAFAIHILSILPRHSSSFFKKNQVSTLCFQDISVQISYVPGCFSISPECMLSI